MELARLVDVARGDKPADLVLKNARLVNVFNGEIEETDIAVSGSRIVGISKGYVGKEELDLGGAYVAPGFIDAHVHIESSMMSVREFSRVVVTHGVTTVIADPHEIANVLGLDGIRYILEMAKYGPISVYVMVPSCVPATDMGTSGARLNSYDMAPLLSDPWVLGMGEMMNFPGVVHGDPDVVAKLRAFRGAPLDGHAPGLSGKALQAYVSTGISSDHESTTVEEAAEKLRLGMMVYLREATNAHNLVDLLPLVNEKNVHRLAFCTDDRHPPDLLDEGSIDFMIRTAVDHGVDPVLAIRMATLNPATHYGLHDKGAVAPGRRADMVVFDSLEDIRPRLVFRGGKLVVKDGRMVPWPPHPRKVSLRSSMNVRWDQVDFRIPNGGDRVRVIGVVPDQLVTEHLVMDAAVEDGLAVADISRDILKMAVIERHQATGNVGKGFVHGIGLKSGAIASSVAHDAHNLVVIGADDRSMWTAAHAVADMMGGLAVADGDRILATLPLPIAGLMSTLPAEEIRGRMDELLDAAHSLGSGLHDPFMAMSFLALEVIPSLKLTDQGLVDVDRFEFVPLFV